MVLFDGQYLLVKPYLGSGAWKLPGGGIRKSETYSTAACRELDEELGVRVKPEDFVPLGEAVVNEDGHRYHAHFLAVKIEGPLTLKLRWWEISDIHWYSPATGVKYVDDPAIRHAMEVWASQ